MKFDPKCNTFHSRKLIWKYHLQSGDHLPRPLTLSPYLSIVWWRYVSLTIVVHEGKFIHGDSQVRLFADDCLVYRPIRSEADQVLLQRDLSALELWGDTWGMRFNAIKCNIMRISRSRNPLTRMYSLCNHVLSEVDTAKYLGINLSSELSWSPHVSSVVSKANSTLGFLRRNLRKCPSKLKETAYLSLVRSNLEYAATIWDPYYVRDIDSLEQVQRRAARFTTGDNHTTSSVTAMLAELGWKRLEDRRKDLRLTLLYKIVHDHVAVPVDALNLEPPDPRTRKKHKYTYQHLTPHTDPYKHLFLCRTIPEWKSLPASAVEATSVESFKTHLAGRPRGTSRDQAPQPIRDTLQRRTADYATRPDQTSKCLALIAQMARAFGMNPTVGCWSPFQVETFSVSNTLVLSQEHPFVCRKWMLLPAHS